MKDSLTPAQISKLDKLEAVITRGLQTFVDVGNSLCAIREEKLYLRDFETFEAYCQSRWGWSRQRSLQLINAAELIENLPPTLAAKVETEWDARALLPLDPKEQKRVIREADKEGITIAEKAKQGHYSTANIDDRKSSKDELAKKPTNSDLDTQEKAKSFSEKPANIDRNVTTAVVKGQNGKEQKSPRTDCFNRTIPADVIPDWDRAHEVGNHLRALVSEVKVKVDKGIKEQDVVFHEITNPTVSDAEALHYVLSQILPYVVCPTCQGRARGKCLVCRGSGWISKHLYNSGAVSKAVKAIIEKGETK